MKKIFPILAALCILFGFNLTGAAQDKTVDKAHVKQLEAIYKEFDAATKKRDLKRFEKYLDEKFEVEQDGRKFSRDEILAVMKMLFDAAIEITEVVTKIDKINVTDGKYLLETSTVMKGKFKMPDGKISDVEIYSKSTDRWIKTEKGWKEISQIDRGSKILADGKEAPM
jgi:GTP-binding protein EngB required for normal cell division